MNQSLTADHPPAIPPPEALLQMTAGMVPARLVYVAARLGIADLLRDGPQSIAQLAEATETHAPSLYRILRALASLGIFTEDEPGRFALTPMAEWLRSDEPGSLRDFVIFVGEPWHLRPWEEILYSVKTGQPAFDKVHGMGGFDYVAQHPAAAQSTDEAMTSLTDHFAAALISAYDFSSVSTLVDVGGGNGMLLARILRAHPQMRGLLLELPHAIEGARRRGYLEAEDVRGRVELIPGNFLDSVPGGADTYLLKDIVHDWSDEHCTAILRNCRQGLAENGKVLLVERIIVPGNELSPAKLMDIEMLVMLTGRERTEAEFAALLEKVGLKLQRTLATASPWHLLEAVPA